MKFDHTITIAASPSRILGAFFDPVALVAWWQAVRSITAPRPLGLYAIEWEPTAVRDEILGSLGGIFYGVVMDIKPAHEFFVADAHWLPPEGDPVGPMALHVSCEAAREGETRLHVVQSGYEDGERWRRYYEVVSAGWCSSLELLKTFAEQDLAERLWGQWGQLNPEHLAKVKRVAPSSQRMAPSTPAGPSGPSDPSRRPPDDP